MELSSLLWYIGSCSAAADTWIQRGLSSDVEDGAAQEYWFSYDNGGPVRSWDRARLDCKSKGATLLHVKDIAEQDWIRLRSSGKRLWIGCKVFNKSGKTGEWKWVHANETTGGCCEKSNCQTEAGFTNWAPDEPSHANEDCAEIDARHDFKWNDVKCSSRKQYVCERAEKESPSTATITSSTTLEPASATTASRSSPTTASTTPALPSTTASTTTTTTMATATTTNTPTTMPMAAETIMAVSSTIALPTKRTTKTVATTTTTTVTTSSTTITTKTATDETSTTLSSNSIPLTPTTTNVAIHSNDAPTTTSPSLSATVYVAGSLPYTLPALNAEERGDATEPPQGSLAATGASVSQATLSSDVPFITEANNSSSTVGAVAGSLVLLVLAIAVVHRHNGGQAKPQLGMHYENPMYEFKRSGDSSTV